MLFIRNNILNKTHRWKINGRKCVYAMQALRLRKLVCLLMTRSTSRPNVYTRPRADCVVKGH